MTPITKPGEADLTALRKEPHDGEGGADIEFREGWNACLDRLAALGTAPATPVPEPRNVGHGHVFPRPDGMVAKCGGPLLCQFCKGEASRL